MAAGAGRLPRVVALGFLAAGRLVFFLVVVFFAAGFAAEPRDAEVPFLATVFFFAGLVAALVDAVFLAGAFLVGAFLVVLALEGVGAADAVVRRVVFLRDEALPERVVFFFAIVVSSI